MRRLVLFWLSIAFLLGIISAFLLHVYSTGWIWAASISFILAIIEAFLGKRWLFYQKVRAALPAGVFLIALVICVGGWRYSLATQPAHKDEVSFYNDRGKVEVEGFICGDPLNNQNSTTIVICAQSLLNESGSDQPLHGKILVRTRVSTRQYGDQVRLTGALILPPEEEGFSYRFYLQQRGIGAMMEYPFLQSTGINEGKLLLRGIFSLRARAYAFINQALPQPEAGLLAGILLGIEKDIPADIERNFQNTGTAHIIAISGYNMTLLAGLVLAATRKRFSIPWAGALSILIIALYTILVGAAPAVMRAALMSSLALSAHLIGRKGAGVFTLILTVAVLCLFNPLYLWDAGFQLSVMATLGLVLYADRLSAWFEHIAGRWLSPVWVLRLKGPIGEYFLFTLAAQVTTLPIILSQFERFSFSSLITNPLVLPVQPLVMIFGGLSVCAGLLIQPIGQLFAYLAWVPLTYTIRMVSLLAAWQAGSMPIGQFNFQYVLIFYAILAFLTFTVKKPNVIEKARKPIVYLSALLFVTLLVWQAVLTRADGNLRVIFFGKPNQGAILILTPDGNRVLVDGATQANELSPVLAKYLPLMDRHLDLIVYRRQSVANLQAFPLLLQRFPTRQVLWAAANQSSSRFRTVMRILEDDNIPSFEVSPGAVIQLDENLRLINDSENEDGADLLLEYKNLRLLLPVNGELAIDQITLDGNGMPEGIIIPATTEDKTTLILQTDGEKIW